MTLLRITVELADDHDVVSGAPWRSYDPLEIAESALGDNLTAQYHVLSGEWIDE